LNLWRGAVDRALRGRRGQAFLKEMLDSLDAMPEKMLTTHELEADGEVCALGAVGRARGMDMKDIDPEDHEDVAAKFGVSHAMACEIMYLNDEFGPRSETPKERFARMRAWVVTQL
jgi:hypothetical protein